MIRVWFEVALPANEDAMAAVMRAAEASFALGERAVIENITAEEFTP